MSAAHTKEPPCGPAGQASRVRRLLWQTVRWDDGAVYRGLSDAETGHCDAVGAFEYPTGDKYEGTYKANHMDGFGIYTWKNGNRYEGEWSSSNMNGCGRMIVASQQQQQQVSRAGEWHSDVFVGAQTAACPRRAVDAAVQQARAAARQARELARQAAARESTPKIQ